MKKPDKKIIIKNSKPKIIKPEKNKDISFGEIMKDFFSLFIFLTFFVFLAIGLVRIIFTVESLDYKEGIIVVLIIFIIVASFLFLNELTKVLKNEKKVNLIASFLKDSITPIIALSFIFLGKEMSDKIKLAVQVNEIYDNMDFLILFIGSALLIVTPVIAIIFNVRILYNKTKK